MTSSSIAPHVRTTSGTCAVLDVLQQHRLFVKRSKYAFGVGSIQYLGHIISADGVAMDLTKV